MPSLSRFLPPPAVRTWLVRLLTLAVLLLFAYQFVRTGERIDWPAFVAALGRPGNWRYLAVVLLLMPLNWLLETRKWQLLLLPFIPWSFWRTFRVTLAGVSVSAATPNRVGEIGGRLLVTERSEWPAVVTSSLLGSVCQWVAFLVLAWPALVYTLADLPGVHLDLSLGWLLPLGPAVLLLLAVGGKPLLLRLVNWGEGRLLRDASALRRAIDDVKLVLMLRASLYAALRFVVYSTQLYLLLGFFGLPLPYFSGMAGIMAIYLVQAGIPLPPGVNLVTRTELGLLLWSVEPAGAVAVLAAYTTLFCVNVLLPSLPGYWWIVRKHTA